MSWLVPGYLDARECFGLLEDIQSKGTSTTLAYYRAQVDRGIRRVLADVDDRSDLTDVHQDLYKVMSECMTNKHAERLARDVVDDYFDANTKTFDIDEVVEALMDSDWLYEYYEPDEENFIYECEEDKYQTSWLGGALNVCIEESKWSTPCYMCSICVKGYGNLGQACSSDEGNCEAYCPAPDEWDGWVEIKNLVTGEVIKNEAR